MKRESERGSARISADQRGSAWICTDLPFSWFPSIFDVNSDVSMIFLDFWMVFIDFWMVCSDFLMIFTGFLMVFSGFSMVFIDVSMVLIDFRNFKPCFPCIWFARLFDGSFRFSFALNDFPCNFLHVDVFFLTWISAEVQFL